MKCPSCKSEFGITVNLDPNLQATRCAQCGGHWIPLNSYERWQATLPAATPATTGAPKELTVMESPKGKICPECRRLLLRYKVGHGLDFGVDHCSTCGGIWLDKNEWEALQSNGLHDDLHRMFAPAWQKQVREEDLGNAIEAAYFKKLGKTTYDKARDFKEWLIAQDAKALIITYLSEE